MSDLTPIAVLDPDTEAQRHELWRKVAQWRTELLLNPTAEVHIALAEALVQLRDGNSST